MKLSIKEYLKTIKGTVSLALNAVMILGIILALFATNNALESASEEIYLTNENEIKVFTNSFDLELESTVLSLNEIIEEFWYSPSGFVQINTTQYFDMITSLRTVCKANEDITAVFYLPGEDYESGWVGFSNTKLSYAQSLNLKTSLHEIIDAGKSRQISFFSIDEENYISYYIYNEKNNIYMGAMFSIPTLLSNYGIEDNNDISYFVDENDRLWGRENIDGIYLEDLDASGAIYSFKDAVSLVIRSSQFSYGIVRVVDKSTIYGGMSKSFVVFLIMAIIFVILNPLISRVMDKKLYQPLNRLHNAMQQIENENLYYRMNENESSPEFDYSKRVFNSMADEIQNLRIKTYEDEIERLSIEATNIRLQVSPHMLQNSLNIIYNLALSKNVEVIQQFVPALSDYFRYSLEKHDELVPIKNELKFVDDYLRVQKIRFPKQILYVYDVDESLMDVLIPPLLIQNFVENTVKYGLKPDDETEIIIVIKKNEDMINISVVDTGMGMSEEILSNLKSEVPFKDHNGEHIGIWNCRRRLAMIYNGKANISITSGKGEGTQIFIEIPFVNEVNDENTVG